MFTGYISFSVKNEKETKCRERRKERMFGTQREKESEEKKVLNTKIGIKMNEDENKMKQSEIKEKKSKTIQKK